MRQIIVGMVGTPDGKNTITYDRIPEDYLKIRLEALKIAGSVFNNFTGTTKAFCKSVDLVFKAAGLEKVDWE